MMKFLIGLVLGFGLGIFWAYLIQAFAWHYSDKISKAFRKWLFKES